VADALRQEKNWQVPDALRVAKRELAK